MKRRLPDLTAISRSMASLMALIASSLLLFTPSQAMEIVLHVPIMADSPNQHPFFHELLTTALQEAGHSIRLVPRKLPQSRVVKYLDAGEISLFWLLESAQRNQAYLPIEVGLTNGLIGKRVLLIRKGDQYRFDQVKTLEDLRALRLVGGMGEGWFDVQVWQANGLIYREQSGNWESIFRKLALGRDFDYFARGANEILAEAGSWPDLDIEQRLLLVYDRDFRFYLSPAGPHAGAPYREAISAALNQAQHSGLIDRLVKKYWAPSFKALNLDKRIRIRLAAPKG